MAVSFILKASNSSHPHVDGSMSYDLVFKKLVIVNIALR